MDCTNIEIAHRQDFHTKTLVLMVAFCQDISSRAVIKKTDVFVATKYTGTTDLKNGFSEYPFDM